MAGIIIRLKNVYAFDPYVTYGCLLLQALPLGVIINVIHIDYTIHPSSQVMMNSRFL